MANVFIDAAMRTYGGKEWRFETHALPRCEVKAPGDIETPLTVEDFLSCCREPAGVKTTVMILGVHLAVRDCGSASEWCCLGLEGAKGRKLARRPEVRWIPTSRLESWGHHHGQGQRAVRRDQVRHLQGQGGNAGSHKTHCWHCICPLLSPRSMGCQEGFPILDGQVTWTPCALERSDQMGGAVQEWTELCVHLGPWYREPSPGRIFYQWQRAWDWRQQWAVHMDSHEHQRRFG